MSEQPAVAVSRLRVALGDGGTDIVDEVDLVVRRGEVLGLVGESGSGKTTIGMALLGHCRGGARIDGGAIRIDGSSVTAMEPGELRRLRGGDVSYIPQDPPTSLNPVLRIGVQLRELLDAHRPQMPADARRARVAEVLDEVALPADPDFLDRYPHQLSGGQQQRLAIAMAFVCRPKVIVCDEPTTGLDVTTQARVLDTIRSLCRAHSVAAVYVSHDLAVVSQLADRVAVLYAGRVVEIAPRAELFAEPRHPYTQRLLLAAPDLAGERAGIGIPGHAPMPGSRPSGCAFAPRCPLATDVCRKTFPPAANVGTDHQVRCHHHATAAAAVPGERPARTTHAGDVILALRAVTASHNRSAVVHDVSFELRAHECLALVGESGSGKTTLARCVAGLHDEYTGEVVLRGETLRPAAGRRSVEQRQRLQYVFQNPYASLNPRRTVGQSLAAPLRLFHGLRGDAAERRARELLERVSLSSTTSSRFPDELSGGERQRVAIARALAADPAVLVCDEVTSALDVSVQATVVELLDELRRDMGLSLLFITHNLALIRAIADRVAVMSGGRIVESASVEDVFRSPQADYTKELLANTPSIAAAA
ncbi:MAG TPA: ABC transporter ATP-binding protein [Baekduia sp.]|nr:ABC transporter ATP-binding protein [Baekduia sp.]